MTDEKELTLTSDCTDKEVHLHMRQVNIGDNSSVNICPCCCCGGSGNNKGCGGMNNNGDGDGNGNGNGAGDGNGNGGGNGGGNGNGEGSGNDDDKPGDIEISLLGGTTNEYFYALDAVEDGYAVRGMSNRRKLLGDHDTAIFATYDKNLRLTSQTHYTNIGAATQHICMSIDPAGSRYIMGGHAANSSYRVPALMEVDMESKEVEKAKRWSTSSDHSLMYLGAVQETFTGSASLIGVGSNGWIAAYDSDLNMLNAVACKASGKTITLRGALAFQDTVLAVGQASGNFANGALGALLVVMDENLNERAIYAYGYDKDIRLEYVVQTPRGLVFAGRAVNKSNGSTDVILVEMDENYAVTRQAMVSLGSRNDNPYSFAADTAGNLLLSGLTTNVGAGSNDMFLIRLNPDFNVTKKLVFGSSKAEARTSAIFNKDGSVTFVGGTPGAGAGGTDALIATVRGDWSELTGSVKKYPALKINANINVKVEKNFSLQVNNNTSYSLSPYTSFTEESITVVADTDPGFLVDVGAVVGV